MVNKIKTVYYLTEMSYILYNCSSLNEFNDDQNKNNIDKNYNDK